MNADEIKHVPRKHCIWKDTSFEDEFANEGFEDVMDCVTQPFVSFACSKYRVSQHEA